MCCCYFTFCKSWIKDHTESHNVPSVRTCLSKKDEDIVSSFRIPQLIGIPSVLWIMRSPKILKRVWLNSEVIQLSEISTSNFLQESKFSTWGERASLGQTKLLPIWSVVRLENCCSTEMLNVTKGIPHTCEYLLKNVMVQLRNLKPRVKTTIQLGLWRNRLLRQIFQILVPFLKHSRITGCFRGRILGGIMTSFLSYWRPAAPLNHIPMAGRVDLVNYQESTGLSFL